MSIHKVVFPFNPFRIKTKQMHIDTTITCCHSLLFCVGVVKACMEMKSLFSLDTTIEQLINYLSTKLSHNTYLPLKNAYGL
jgi:hypothetical protein